MRSVFALVFLWTIFALQGCVTPAVRSTSSVTTAPSPSRETTTPPSVAEDMPPETPPPSLTPSEKIIGEWKFYKMSLDGVEMPPRDPRLDLRYTFLNDGSDKLYWSYDAGLSFCERKGQYLYKDGYLMDEINWVNPQNKSDCASDVDMQLGRKSTSRIDILNDELVLHIPFTDKEMLYFWKRVSTQE